MPSEIRLAVVRKMLEAAGWKYERTKGSHHQFVKPGHRTYGVPVHGGNVKPFYVREIEKIIASQAKEG